MSIVLTGNSHFLHILCVFVLTDELHSRPVDSGTFRSEPPEKKEMSRYREKVMLVSLNMLRQNRVRVVRIPSG